MFTVVSFYHFTKLSEPLDLKPKIQSRCNELDLKGSIILAKEGINGTISGSRSSVDQILKDIRLLPNCKNIHSVLSSEDELLAVFSKNRKALKKIIAKQYRQVCSKWHTGFWIFGGIRQ